MERIYPYLLIDYKGHLFDNVHDTVNDILWILRTNSPWKGLPPVYGNGNTIYKRFAKWKKTDVFESIFKIFLENADIQDVSIDSPFCKAHQHSAGAEKVDLIPVRRTYWNDHARTGIQRFMRL